MIAHDLYNMRRLTSPIVVDIACWLFIVLWVYAAVNKFLDIPTFTAKLGQSPMLLPIAGFVAWFIPLTEILIALLLAFNVTRTIGLYASFGLMSLFTVYIVAITRFASYVPCSCGGILENMTWTQHLYFNMAFVALAVIGVYSARRAAIT